MLVTVALVATLAMAAPADTPRDAAGWREQAELLYSRGDYRGALEAAQRARELDRGNPWVRLTWVRVMATVDRNGARDAMAGLQDPATVGALAQEDRARLHTALGLGVRAVASPFVVGYVDVGYGSGRTAVFSGINYPF